MSDLEAGGRTVVWVSAGAASAVAAHLIATENPLAELVYCDVSIDEHPDNERFLADVEAWTRLPVRRIKSDKYASVDEVFAARTYMAGIAGAPCTVEMKKVPRFGFQLPTDIHVFGFTADEQHRIDRFKENNPELLTNWVLADRGITKQDCFSVLASAQIDIPKMYQLGYNNNNCLGCVKATSAKYWNRIRRDFPEVFEKRAAQSREYGARLTRIRGERVFLDELPADYLPPDEPDEDISCGPDCAIQLTMLVGSAAQ